MAKKGSVGVVVAVVALVLLLTLGKKQSTVTPTAPVVNVGPDLAITLPGTALIVYSITSPNPTTHAFSVSSGPGALAITDDDVSTATVVATLPGAYVIRLTATDTVSNLQGFDELSLTVSPAVNPPPGGATALPDLGTGLYLNAFQGGLYPGGSNILPADHDSAGLIKMALVTPRNTAGVADPAGKIVMASVSMSNGALEFSGSSDKSVRVSSQATPESFMGQVTADPGVNHTSLVLWDAAYGGQSADTWDNALDSNYGGVKNDLGKAGFSAAQVQVVWLKEANQTPLHNLNLGKSGSEPERIERDLGNIVRAAKSNFPNLQFVFLSSRIYGGYAGSHGEPWSYENGFGVKWLIEAQINQMRGLGVDATAGNLDYNGGIAPWLAWGPYIWANDNTPNLDGLAYAQSDFVQADFIHPALGAIQKVGARLLSFFKTSPQTKGWFLAGSAQCQGTSSDIMFHLLGR